MAYFSAAPNTKDEAGDEELRSFVLNSYKVLLTRGVRGCFVYVVDKNLREYLKQFIIARPNI